jgi:small subunit ribosomal protein S17
MAKTLVGVVASDKADKTIVVSVATRKTHPIYKKQYTSTNKFMAHDEQNDAREGDRVSIVETKPLSARKRFALEKVLERAPVRHVETVDEEVAEAVGLKDKEEKEASKAKTQEKEK